MKIEDKVAVISDVHGNSWALREVLEDIGRRRIDDIVNLGDSLYGPLDPAGTADMLLWLNKPAVCGNEDRIIAEASRENEESPTLQYVLANLTADHVHWLKDLKKTEVVYNDLYLCHGTPDRDDEYLLENILETSVNLKSTRELSASVSEVNVPVVLCGHDHVARTVQLPEGKLIVNPGSVGLPAYTEYFPYPHAVEAGSPHARYCVLSRTGSGWLVENIAVPYDWARAAKTAEQNERPDWAEWLRTGRAAAI